MRKIKSYLIWAVVVILTLLFKMLNEIKVFITSVLYPSCLVWLFVLGFCIFSLIGFIVLNKIFLLLLFII